MEHMYSITPLHIDHVDEMCADIKQMYENKVIGCPMFFMKLHPEGIPVIDKVTHLCEEYMMFKERLDAYGVPSGILVQSALGHGYPLDNPMPFTQYRNLKDGHDETVSCPIDERFRDYFREVMKKLAACGPKAIMLDDDCRMLHRPGFGCACEKHMAEFNRRAGTQMTREELYEYILSHPNDDPITLIYVDTQREALHGAIVAMREGIDAVDPTIQGINCTSGETCEFVEYNNPVFAGKGNPTIVRIPNGTYAPITTRGFSDILSRTSECIRKIKGNIDIILCEADTIPFNRYGKCASYLHAQFTVGLLGGCRGAKHWITRLSAYEPKSGAEYRKILAKYAGFYKAIMEISPKIRWQGCKIPFESTEIFNFHREYPWDRKPRDFATKVLERMGIPIYFSDEPGGAAFVDGDATSLWRDETIEKMFEGGSVFLSSDCAKELIKRGFGDKIGVDIKPWNGEGISGEVLTNGKVVGTQKSTQELIPNKSEVYADSYTYHLVNNKEKKHLFPATAVFPRDNGKVTVTFSGTPNAPFTYGEGFAFLNESRKEQLIKLLKMTGNLPVYYSGDAEIMLQAGTISDNEMIIAAWNIGMDILPEFPIVCDKEIKKIEFIDCDGKRKNVNFTKNGDELILDLEVKPLLVQVLILTH